MCISSLRLKNQELKKNQRRLGRSIKLIKIANTSLKAFQNLQLVQRRAKGWKHQTRKDKNLNSLQIIPKTSKKVRHKRTPKCKVRMIMRIPRSIFRTMGIEKATWEGSHNNKSTRTLVKSKLKILDI